MLFTRDMHKEAAKRIAEHVIARIMLAALLSLLIVLCMALSEAHSMSDAYECITYALTHVMQLNTSIYNHI
jgi:hypothetical protein